MLTKIYYKYADFYCYDVWAVSLFGVSVFGGCALVARVSAFFISPFAAE